MYKHFATLRHIGKDAFIFCHVALSLKHSASSHSNFDSWYFLLLLQPLIAYLQSFNQEEKRKRLETLSICQQNYVL